MFDMIEHGLLLPQDLCTALDHCCAAQREAVRLSRKNDNMRPFEPGGETELEHLAQRADAGLFLMDSHSKKRPHNLILGRLFNHRLLDLVGAYCGVCAWPGWLTSTVFHPYLVRLLLPQVEVGVETYRSIRSFGSAAVSVQAGNKVSIVVLCRFALAQQQDVY